MQQVDLSTPSNEFLEQVKAGYTQDPFYSHALKTRKVTFDGSFWLRHSFVVVPDVPDAGTLQQHCLELPHSYPYTGHLGRDRILDLVTRHYW